MTNLNSRDRCLFFTHLWAHASSGKSRTSFLEDLQFQSGSKILDTVLPKIAERYNGFNLDFVVALTESLNFPNPYLDSLVAYWEISGNSSILLHLIEFAKIEMWLDSLAKNSEKRIRLIETFSDAVRLVAGLHVLASCAPELVLDLGMIQRFDCTPSFLAAFEQLSGNTKEKKRFSWKDLPELLKETQNPFLSRGTPLWWAARFIGVNEVTGMLDDGVAQKYIDLAIAEFKATIV